MYVRLIDVAYLSCPKDIESLILLDVIVASDLTWSVLRLKWRYVMLHDVSITFMLNSNFFG